jgi:hypothetical protein
MVESMPSTAIADIPVSESAKPAPAVATAAEKGKLDLGLLVASRRVLKSSPCRAANSGAAVAAVIA